MSSVDDRIVNMQFNNKQFTQGAAESERSLTNLEKTLGNMGKSKGIDSLGSSIEQTSKKFSIMQIAGVTAVATIANKAVDAGLRFAKSFTIDPIKDGWNEYNTTLKSVQTIMSNTGATVNVVNKYLDDMNHFSDKTIYNFAEMARNLGTFTAAGVDLKTAKASIQGIANVAALSGSSSMQASTAMYQLSQALAAGKVGAQDWNSVVNAGMGGKKLQTIITQTAVAMGRLNKAQLSGLKAGEALKISGESFRNSIMAKPGAKIWFDSDVLKNSLAIMDGGLSRYSMRMDGITDKQQQNNMLQQKRNELVKKGLVFGDAEWKQLVKTSNAAFKAATQVKSLPDLIGTVRESVGSLFAQGFRTIVGDFDQSKDMWTAANGVITTQLSKVSNALFATKKDVHELGLEHRGILTIWAKKGGRVAVVEGIQNAFKALFDVMGTVKGAFNDVFGNNTRSAGLTLLNLSNGFKKFTEAMRPSEETMKSLRSIFGGVFAAMHIGLSIIVAVGKAFGSLFGEIFKSSSDGRSGILTFLASIGEAIKAFDKFITSGGRLEDVFSAIGKSAGTVIGPIVKMVGFLVKGIAALATGKGLSGFGAQFEGVKAAFADLISVLAGAGEVITAPFESLSDWFDKIQSKAENFKSSLSGVTGIFGGIGGGDSGSKAEATASSFEKTSKAVLTTTTSMLGLKNASADADGTTSKLSTSMGHISTATDSAKNAVMGLASSLGGSAMDEGAKKVDNATSATDTFQSRLDKLKAVAGVVGNIIGAGFQKIGSVLKAVGNEFKQLFGGKDALDWASLMNAIFTGVLILSIKRFMDTLGASFVTFRQLAGQIGQEFSMTMDSVRGSLEAYQSTLKGQALMRIAIAVGILAASIIALSFVPADKLKNGLGAVAIAMGLLVGSLYLLNKVDAGGSIALIATSFVSMATAVAILTAALAVLAFIPVDKLSNGLGAIATLMVILTGAMFALTKATKGAPVAAGAMVVMAIAIDLLVGAVAALGALPIDKLDQGLKAIAVLMALLVGSLTVLSSFGKFAAGGATAMIGLAIAVNMLVPAIAALGLIKADKLWKGIKALALVITILTVSLVALSLAGPAVILAGLSLIAFAFAVNMLIPAIIILGNLDWGTITKALIALTLLAIPITALGLAAMVAAPGFLALAAALLIAGVGMALFGTGFAVLTAAGVAGVGILVIAFQAFLALLPQLGIQLAAAFVSFLDTIAAASGRIRKAFDKIFTAILGVVQDSIPTIVDLLNALMDGIFDLINAHIPRMAKTFTKLMRAGLKAIRDIVPDMIETGWFVLQSFLQGIEDHIDDVIQIGTRILRKLIRGISNAVVELANEFGDAVVHIIEGIDAAIENNSRRIRSAGLHLMGTLAKGMLEWSPASVVGSIISNITNSLKKRGAGKSAGGGGATSDTPIPDPPTAGGKSRIFSKALANQAAQGGGGGNNAAKKVWEQLGNTLGTSLVSGMNAALQNGTIAALDNMIRLMNRGNDTLQNLIQQSFAKNLQAQRTQNQADILSNQASRKKYNKKTQKRLQKAADAAQRQADARQTVAEEADAALERQQRLLDAGKDQAALADAHAQNATDLGEQSRDKLAQSQAAALAAGKLEEQAAKASAKQAKKLRAQAAALRTQANQLAAAAASLAAQASSEQANAAAAASQNILEQLDALKKKHDEEIKEEQDAKAFEEADQAGKLKILQDRQAAAEEKARKAEADYQQALRDADAARAAGNITEAQRLLDLASTYSDQANAARDETKQIMDDIKNLNGSDSSLGGGSGTLTPSGSILENAASIVDSFTQSMQDALVAAGSAPSIVQFNQNNYSPEALNASEVYRQSNNLVTFAANKFAPAP